MDQKCSGEQRRLMYFFEVGNHRFWGMINCGFHELEIFFFKAAEQRNIRVRKKSWYQNEKKIDCALPLVLCRNWE